MQGFVRVAACSPALRVADAAYNTDGILNGLSEMARLGAKIALFPENCLVGATAGDLVFQPVLTCAAMDGLMKIRDVTRELDIFAVVSLPVAVGGRMYLASAAVSGGEVLGFVPKTCLTARDGRYYADGGDAEGEIRLPDGKTAPLSAKLVFRAENAPDLMIGIEMGDAALSPATGSSCLALSGATLILNPTAAAEYTGRRAFREQAILAHSARLTAGYVTVNAGSGESTQDMVFAGGGMIAENGVLLDKAGAFEGKMLVSDIDLAFIARERRKNPAFRACGACREIPFRLENPEPVTLVRAIDPAPFIPAGDDKAQRLEEILSVQAHGLARRYLHTRANRLVIGVSGGLDSTLAMIVAARALDIAGKSRDKLLAVTMPCFGTTERTHGNAVKLSRGLGAELTEINIRESVTQHFRDIGLPETARDVTYENGQARERTQVLMDLANRVNGLVVGTGDISELALGWATYNGDHMSMYGVNGSVPKTLIRHLVAYEAERLGSEELRDVLRDILDTPVSPELLPPDEAGDIAQKTEDLVGPYELHDFFLFHLLRRGDEPERILELARAAFSGAYPDEVIRKWLSTFLRRFFIQQFKRSCIPDGPAVGTVSLSPRGEWMMPTDASGDLWKI